MNREFSSKTDRLICALIRHQSGKDTTAALNALQQARDSQAPRDRAEEWDSALWALEAWVHAWQPGSRPKSHEDMGRQFFNKARMARKNGWHDAAEIYYLSAMLGFQGNYQDNQKHEKQLAADGHPADLKDWLEQSYKNPEEPYVYRPDSRRTDNQTKIWHRKVISWSFVVLSLMLIAILFVAAILGR